MKRIKNIVGIIFFVSLIAGIYYLYINEKAADHKGPVLSARSESITVGLDASDQEILEGIAAFDDKDGDVSDSILIENIKKQEEGEDNAFTVTYVAFDKSNNAGRISRTLYYEDYRKPRFTLTQRLRFPENQDFSLFNYVHADDCIDGDISPFITFYGNDTIPEKPDKGIYDCTLQVKNSVGDSALLPVQIEIYEDSYEEHSLRPQIILKEYLTYIEKGDKFRPEDYLDYVNDQGILLIGPAQDKTENTDNTDNTEDMTSDAHSISVSRIDIHSDVDTDVPGIYSAEYSYKSEKTGYECNASLIVIVE